MTTPRSTQPENSQNEHTRAGGSRAKNAIAFLKNDHRVIEDLFEEYEHARRENRKEALVREICDELTVHAQLEEQAFYPAAQKALGKNGKDLVDEARVEHNSLKWLIAQLEQESPDSELYAAKVTVLKEYVQHHVKEEEKQLFPKLRQTELDLEDLGQTLIKAKQALQEQHQQQSH